MEQLIKNLSPLIGCKIYSLRWCPYTAYQVCKDLRLASLVCLDLDNDVVRKGPIRYGFENKVSIGTYEIHEKVLNLDKDIMDSSYIIQSQNYVGIPENLKNMTSLNDALFYYATNNIKNDSAIIDTLDDLGFVKQSYLYKYMLFILLDSYSLRYSLYNHYILGDDLDFAEIRDERLKRLIDNIDYVKLKLEEMNADKTVDLNHHLSTLLYNVCLIRKKLKDEFVEIEEI